MSGENAHNHAHPHWPFRLPAQQHPHALGQDVMHIIAPFGRLCLVAGIRRRNGKEVSKICSFFEKKSQETFIC
jgi:hypothetical protein